MSSNLSTRTGNIREFKIFQAKNGGIEADASAVTVDIKYYENKSIKNIYIKEW